MTTAKDPPPLATMKFPVNKALFITFEGMDGGKTTQMHRLVASGCDNLHV